MRRPCLSLTTATLAAIVSCTACIAQQTLMLDDLAAPGTWEVYEWNKAPGEAAASDEFPGWLETGDGARRGSVAATIDWPEGEDFVFFSLRPAAGPIAIPFQASGISVWVRGTGTGHGLEVGFEDAEGTQVKVGLGTVDFGDWRKLRAKIPPEWPQPLRVTGLTLHNWGLTDGDKVTALFARLEASVDPDRPLSDLEDSPRLTISGTAQHGRVGPDGKASLQLALASWDTEEQVFELRQSLVDWTGTATPLGTLPVRMKGSWKHQLDVELTRYGPLTYRAELWPEGADEPATVAERRLVKLPPVPRLSREERDRSYIGVNTHWNAKWETLAACGVHWARDYCWGWLKHGQDAPMADNGVDFRPIIQGAEAAGITILPITMQSFRNAADNGFIQDQAAIAKGYARLAKAFPDIPYWELDNEADLHFGEAFDLENYQGFIAGAAGGLRASGTGAKVALNGTAGIRFDQAAALLDSPVADDFDVVNYHCYTGTAPPEIGRSDINAGADLQGETLSFLDQMRRINRLAHEAGKQAWLTEVGWDATYGPAVGERLQAVYLPRVYLLARLCGTDQVYWYFDRDVEDSTGIFASCGVLDVEQTLRPCAVALAQLSRETALAEPGGSVDLGEDQWCVVLKRPEGGWVAAAWTVEDDHPMPKELEAADAFDIFGNPFEPSVLSPEVAYFHLAELPDHWEAQRTVEWLSPTLLTTTSGGSVPAEARASVDTLDWEGLPEGVTAEPWTEKAGEASSALTCAVTVRPGDYALTATASGDGWTRRWPVALRVLPSVVVDAPPYAPGQPVPVELRSNLEGRHAVALTLPEGGGQFERDSVDLDGDTPTQVEFTASADATGPIRVELALDNGARQEAWLRSASVDVPRAGEMELDGSLEEWGGAPALEGQSLHRKPIGFAPSARLAWSDEGLWLAVSIPMRDLRPVNPRDFWRGTCVELWVDPSGAPGGGIGDTAHQFWFTPVRDGEAWRLYAGEWKRGGAIEKTLYDDGRCRTAVRVTDEGVTMEALVPTEALGGIAPSEAAAWPCAVTLQAVTEGETKEASWPRAKDSGILDRTDAWGTIRLRP